MDSGTVAGRYRLLRVIGTGGMSRVWLARDEILAREVAVKEVLAMPGLPPGQADLWARTIAEGRAAARLAHPNVVRVYDVLFTGGRPWIVMEYVPSRSLEDVVRKDGPLEPDVAARVGLAVLDGLAAAHRAGVLHRDVKPPNVLITDDGRVLLGDFGIAVLHDEVDGPETLLIASPSYVAPERVRDHVSSVETDLWSFGATVYWCVEGRPPYARGTTAEVLAALATSPPDPVERAGPLREVLEGLLRRDPAERLTAQQARAMLTEVAPVQRSAAVPALVAPLAATMRLFRAAAAPVPVAPALTTAAARPDDEDVVQDERRRTVARILVAALGVLLVAGGIVGLVAATGDARPVFVDRAQTGQDARTAGGTGKNEAAAAARAAATCADGAVPPGTVPLPPAPAGGGASSSGGAPAGGSAPAGGAAPAGGVGLPAGWVWHDDPAGFRIGRPAGWVRAAGDGIVCFLDPAGGRRLTVGVGPATVADRVAYWRAAEQDLLRLGPPPGYTSIGIGPVVYARGAADWEFTYDGAGGARWHTSRRLFGVGDGRELTLSWTTGDGVWGPGQETFRVFAASFGAR
ncbi:serine/threonine-protein kinase [Dactylosporangium sp. NPDC049525]|uniref:serine/threonine-protein kinase n=1 Tax=Dactylosporangium sp. NPDC049525 TaxID=3154730 RepID=UPI0034402DB0